MFIRKNAYNDLLDEVVHLRKENASLRNRLNQIDQTLVSEEIGGSIPEFAWAGNLGRWKWDYATGKVDFNRLKVDVLGYDYDTFERNVNSFTSLIHPDDFGPTMENMRLHLVGETPAYETEYRLRCSDNSYKWFYDRGMVLERNNKGVPVTIIGIVFDITDRKKAEQEREKKLHDLEEEVHHLEDEKSIAPICASCKSIRDDDGNWHSIEDAINGRCNISFTHTICPDCAVRLYPDLYKEE